MPNRQSRPRPSPSLRINQVFSIQISRTMHDGWSNSKGDVPSACQAEEVIPAVHVMADEFAFQQNSYFGFLKRAGVGWKTEHIAAEIHRLSIEADLRVAAPT